jgi:hypothetical protein
VDGDTRGDAVIFGPLCRISRHPTDRAQRFLLSYEPPSLDGQCHIVVITDISGREVWAKVLDRPDGGRGSIPKTSCGDYTCAFKRF